MISHLFNKLIDIKEKSIIDVDGDTKYFFTVKSENIPCRIQKYKYNEKVLGGRQKSSLMYEIFISYDTDISLQDIVFYGEDDFNIISLEKEGNVDLYQKILVEKI